MALHAKVDELNKQQHDVLERIERRLAVQAAHA
jgi:hypothetical protein